MRQVTATCRDCGVVEQSTYAGTSYRCCGCTERIVGRIRRMLDDGMCKSRIAAELGMSVTSACRWIDDHGLAKPRKDAGMRGIGKKPADLVPSRKALGLVSVWGLAHASIEKNFAGFVTPN